jgi:hypothetical protein
VLVSDASNFSNSKMGFVFPNQLDVPRELLVSADQVIIKVDKIATEILQIYVYIHRFLKQSLLQQQ